MAGKSDLTPEEAHTMPASKTLCEILTARGTVFTCGEATVHFVKTWDMSVTVQLLEDSPAVLSSGRLCVENGYTYETQVSLLIKNQKIGKRIKCQVENHGPLVVPGVLSTKSGPEQTALGNASLELPEWAGTIHRRDE